MSDVKDAFHRLGVPVFFSRYFGYLGCTAEKLRMVGETVDNVKLRAWDEVLPTGEVSTDGFRLESVDVSPNWSVSVSTCQFAEGEYPSP